MIKILLFESLLEKEDILKKKLPFLFYIAEMEVRSLKGRMGPEIGLLRERVLIAAFKVLFGDENVKPNDDPLKAEVDVEIFGNPVSIKTGRGTGGVKAIWTSDQILIDNFIKEFNPTADILFVQVDWGKTKNLCLIPLEVQIETFKKFGSEYFKIPKPGTNSRGVSFKKFKNLLENPNTLKIPIFWEKQNLSYDPYRRWMDLYETCSL